LTPDEAVPVLRISKATITRCVQRGAPVHRRGAAGRKYLIDPDEFIPWMEAQVYKQKPVKRSNPYTEKANARRQEALSKSSDAKVKKGRHQS
jgi:phage terminase Nu1 subunit (DNA packaging protein)